MGKLDYSTLEVEAKLDKSLYDGSLAVDMPINDISDPTYASTPDYRTISRGGFTFTTQGYDGGSTVEYKSYRVELAHDTDPASGYEVHFRGTPVDDTTGDVRMVVEYVLQKKAANVVAGGTKTAIRSIVAGGNTAGTEYYFSFPLLPTDTGLSTMEIGDSLWLNIKREPANAADTYGADIAQIEFGVHGYINSLGEGGLELI